MNTMPASGPLPSRGLGVNPNWGPMVMASERIQRQIELFLDEAEEAVAQGNWNTVRDRAQKVLAFDPELTG